MIQSEQVEFESDDDIFFSTQPVEDGNTYSPSDENEENGAWAKLTCCSLNQSHYWLKKDVFVAGRIESCDYRFNQEDHKSSIYPLISKTHFIIEKKVIRDMPVAFIKDVSSNGTYVNDELIGKDLTRVLAHEDVLSVAKIGYRLFTFSYLKDFYEEIPKQVKVEYHLVDRIGKGGFGVVFYVLHKSTCEPFAMKMIETSANIHDHLDVFTELKVLQSIKHENIVAFRGTIMKDNNLFLLLEFMAGGDLHKLLDAKKRLSEPVARHIFHQVTAGVDYLHNHQIIHRDIKPMNILLSSADEYPTVKITDFGLSKKLKKFVSEVKEVVGTPAYRAPELRGQPHQIFDTRVDVWSLGVLLFVCLSGGYPFKNNRSRTMTEVLTFDPLHVWYHISVYPKNIIKRSLSADFMKRPFSKEILRSPWFRVDLSDEQR